MADVLTRIPLRNRDRVIVAHAVIDEADAEQALLTWCLDVTGYAARMIWGHPQRKVYLHRAIMGLLARDGREVDHIDGDKLDCRRSNMRVTTRSQNMQNVPSRASRSKFRGVSPVARANGVVAWRAYAQGRHVGYYVTEDQAAAAAASARSRCMPYANEARSSLS